LKAERKAAPSFQVRESFKYLEQSQTRVQPALAGSSWKKPELFCFVYGLVVARPGEHCVEAEVGIRVTIVSAISEEEIAEGRENDLVIVDAIAIDVQRRFRTPADPPSLRHASWRH
jgi:hypothetical protein